MAESEERKRFQVKPSRALVSCSSATPPPYRGERSHQRCECQIDNDQAYFEAHGLFQGPIRPNLIISHVYFYVGCVAWSVLSVHLNESYGFTRSSSPAVGCRFVSLEVRPTYRESFSMNSAEELCGPAWLRTRTRTRTIMLRVTKREDSCEVNSYCITETTTPLFSTATSSRHRDIMNRLS